MARLRRQFPGASREELQAYRQLSADELQRVRAGAPLRDIYEARSMASIPVGERSLPAYARRHDAVMRTLGMVGNAGFLRRRELSNGTVEYSPRASLARYRELLEAVVDTSVLPAERYYDNDLATARIVGPTVDPYGTGDFVGVLSPDVLDKVCVGGNPRDWFMNTFLFHTLRVYARSLSIANTGEPNIERFRYGFQQHALDQDIDTAPKMFDGGVPPLYAQQAQLLGESIARSVLVVRDPEGGAPLR